MDHRTSEGHLFWSGPKRAPTPIKFNADDETHLDYIQSCTNLYLNVLHAPSVQDREQLRAIAKKSVVAPFVPRSVTIKADDKDQAEEGGADDQTIADQLFEELGKIGDVQAMRLEPVDFEKDDDSNFHILFITATANLRARNYSIDEASFHKVKMIAGRRRGTVSPRTKSFGPRGWDVKN